MRSAVYVVMYVNGPECYVSSIWSTPEAAEEEADKLNFEAFKAIYKIEEWEVQ